MLRYIKFTTRYLIPKGVPLSIPFLLGYAVCPYKLPYISSRETTVYLGTAFDVQLDRLMSVCPKSHWSEKMNQQFPVTWRAPHFGDASILLMEILHQSIYDRCGYCPIMYKVLFIPGAAGFLPSTTSSLPWNFTSKGNIVRPWPTFHISLIMFLFMALQQSRPVPRSSLSNEAEVGG